MNPRLTNNNPPLFHNFGKGKSINLINGWQALWLLLIRVLSRAVNEAGLRVVVTKGGRPPYSTDSITETQL